MGQTRPKKKLGRDQPNKMQTTTYCQPSHMDWAELTQTGYYAHAE
jgi:hypothetical protein